MRGRYNGKEATATHFRRQRMTPRSYLQAEISIHHRWQRGEVDAEASYLLARGSRGSNEFLLATCHVYAALFGEHDGRRVVPPAGDGDLSSPAQEGPTRSREEEQAFQAHAREIPKGVCQMKKL